MDKLNLNFLEKNEHLDLSPLESVLHKVGKEIYDYAKKYFFFIVTNTINAVNVKEFSLYILVPEIGYNYKILTLSYLDNQTVKINSYNLEIEPNQKYEVSIKNSWDLVYKKINKILSSKSTNSVFRTLVNKSKSAKINYSPLTIY